MSESFIGVPLDYDVIRFLNADWFLEIFYEFNFEFEFSQFLKNE